MKKFLANCLLLLALSFSANYVLAAGQSINSGPIAAAGALFLLGQRGYHNLCPDGVNGPALMKVAQILASPQAMTNGLDVGTSTEFPLQGIERYIRRCGYSGRTLKFEGDRPCPQAYSEDTRLHLDWLCANIRAGAGVCILIGWYDHDSKTDVYRRIGGQWVTVLTYQRNQYNKGVPVCLIVSNPSNSQKCWVYFDQMKSGKLAEIDKFGRPIRPKHPASGFYKVMSSLHSSGTPILEGAVAFKL